MWTFDGAVLTFLFPMLLFIGVAAVLYVQYTKPTAVPGRNSPGVESPVTHTRLPGTSAAAAAPEEPEEPEAADGATAAPEVQE